MSSSTLSLDDLAVRHGADKSSKVHGYTRAYERYFSPLRPVPLALLEIGVGNGASLRMWREYFPNATLYGLDVADCTNVQIPGTHIYQGSQIDESALERLLAEMGNVDIVIDDGSHHWADQIAAFRKLYPHVKPGGYYAIEDLHTSYWEHYRGGKERTVWFLRNLVHDLNLQGRSGYGLVANDPEFGALQPDLNVYEATIELISFYKSLALVRKKQEVAPDPSAACY
jgi:hypothetical protein